jgi:endonuclease/exonuclease/phosphatase family metal-dependent hydrolase
MGAGYPARYTVKPMRRHLAIALGAALFAAPATAAAQTSAPVRVMTWNIAGSPYNARPAAGLPFALGDVEAVIARNAPAVLALQETCSWQVSALARDLGLQAWQETTVARFADSRPGAGGTCDYGDALLARAGIAQRLRVNLLDPGACKSDATVAYSPPLPECRVLLNGLVGGFDVATTHVGVDAGQSGELARVVGAAAATDPTQPAVLLGDMNVLPEDPRLAPRLAARGFREVTGVVAGLPCRSAPRCRQTFPAGGPFGKPVSRPDMIFTRRLAVNGAAGPVDVSVGGRPASDHRALIADLQPAAPDGAVAVRPRRLRTVARRGPAASVGVLQATRVRVRLLASTATARALHLRHRLLSSDAVVVSAAGRVQLGLAPGAAARRALERARHATLSIDVRVGAVALPRVTFVVRR